VQPSFWGEALPKIHRGPFHTPRPKYIRRGRTLPHPNLWASVDPLPWGSSGAIAHPQPWESSGAIAHTLPREVMVHGSSSRIWSVDGAQNLKNG